MYQKVLTKQWNNLTEDFVRENRDAPVQTPAQFQEWYRVRSHRFNSVTAVEGMTLDQLHQAEFASALRSAMSRFAFVRPEAQSTPDPRIGVVVGAAAGAALVFLLPLLPFSWAASWLIRILLGLAAFAGIALWQILRVANAQKRERDRAFQEYAGQLEDYLPRLLEVCRAHGIN